MNIYTIIVSFFLSIGGAAGVAFLIVKYLGSKIIDNQFEQSLEKYKFTINSKFDRISKIHEKEFIFLPKLWELLINTYNDFYSLTSFYKEYPNLDVLSDLELDDYIESKNLKKSEIQKIRDAKKKTDAFIDIDFWNKLTKINKSYNDFSLFYFENKIFLTEKLEKSIEDIRIIFIHMQTNLVLVYTDGIKNYDYIYKANEEQKKIEPLLKELSVVIKKRLCFNEAFE